jgi:hypothetical protein
MQHCLVEREQVKSAFDSIQIHYGYRMELQLSTFFRPRTCTGLRRPERGLTICAATPAPEQAGAAVVPTPVGSSRRNIFHSGRVALIQIRTLTA